MMPSGDKSQSRFKAGGANVDSMTAAAVMLLRYGFMFLYTAESPPDKQNSYMSNMSNKSSTSPFLITQSQKLSPDGIINSDVDDLISS